MQALEYRNLGETGMRVSAVSLGTWAFGSEWGAVSDDESYAALNRAIDLGVNFLDTADVYGDGRSERLIGRLLQERSGEEIFVATKAGRRLDPHTAEGYNYENLSRFVERNLENLRLEALDLLQLHCPPTDVYRQDETFEALDRLHEAGKVKNYGVSVEKVEEARMALDYPSVKTVQIIFNIFRQKPAEEFFPIAEEKNIGVLARVPLASGLLSGKMTADREFASDDHRNFNREGQAFDRGETFSGVSLESGLAAAEELKGLVPEGHTLAQLALRWILMHPAVSCAIPGAKRLDQVEDNLAAIDMPPLSEETMERIRDIYDRYVRREVHHLW
jgi:aryl-alcohol dehydrogenase-like predicted oxidoreductase